MSESQDNTGRMPSSGPAGANAEGYTVPANTDPGRAGAPAPAQPAAAPPGAGQSSPAPATMAQPAAGAADPARAGRERGGTAQATMESDSSEASAGPGEAGTRETGRHYVPRPAPGYDDDARPYEARHADGTSMPPSGAALGLTALAAVLMMVSGLLGFFYGLAAIIKGSFFVVLPNYAFSLSAVGWGWIHLAIGAVVFVAGAALFSGALWARIIGVLIASLAIVAYFVSLPYYPVWSVVVIALSAFIIWALLTPRNPIR